MQHSGVGKPSRSDSRCAIPRNPNRPLDFVQYPRYTSSISFFTKGGDTLDQTANVRLTNGELCAVILACRPRVRYDYSASSSASSHAHGCAAAQSGTCRPVCRRPANRSFVCSTHNDYDNNNDHDTQHHNDDKHCSRAVSVRRGYGTVGQSSNVRGRRKLDSAGSILFGWPRDIKHELGSLRWHSVRIQRS